MPTYKLTIEYDGIAYAGWQRQPDQPTIQCKLEEALFQISREATPVVAAGRTDAGVHALGQVVSFRSDKPFTPDEWTRSLNGVLPQDICVHRTERVADAFHARYSARQKTYEYRIHNHPIRPVIRRFHTWHVSKPLNRHSLLAASKTLEGQHDFSSFEGSQTDNQNPICSLFAVRIHSEGATIILRFTADRFLKQMVRAMVGTLVEIGQGKQTPAEMKTILEAKDRRAAGKTAPPQGLFLLSVEYSGQEEHQNQRL